MADTMMNKFYERMGLKELDLDTDNIKCALMAVGYTPDKDNDNWADISANEASGSGYTAGGQILTTVTFAEDDVNDLAKFDSDNPSWATCTITAYYAVLYDDSHANKALIGAWDFGGAKSSSGGTFEVQVNANGWFKIEQGT